MIKDIDQHRINALFGAILKLKNSNEAQRFFRDLLTEKELIEFAQRWQVAQWLDDDVSYLQIAKKIKISSTTIARIQKWLKNGRGGYQLILKRTKNKK